ncbi:glycosyl hydrolase family 61-domain-containing protein [Mycena alexandri]|uniref:lytic cellulose monooxygenase (C4-dehydrogenating) n=1 Tax=Mycena alexandri TaxID=1745969 RepID=A0AAD6SSP9_9AGAR|nr:glycosyl hydrolase family 61-domain-containing protein [Mycena alexandri]
MSLFSSFLSPRPPRCLYKTPHLTHSFTHQPHFHMYSLPVAAAAILASTSLVAGHGQINRVQHGGASNTGPNIYYSGDSANSKTATRMMYKASSPSYVLFDSFTDNSKMSCEGSSKSPAPNTISVAAGEEIDIYWEGATSELKGKAGTGSLTAYNPWVHAMGFVFDYITSCNGDCSTFDATNAGWTKIAHGGIDTSKSISSELRATMKGKPEEYFPTSGPGLWAMAKLVENGSKWSIKIPSSLKSGQYMIRHELAAVHNPKTGDPTTGPQLYITCIQLDVTNGGDMSLPTGTQAKSLYRPDGAFANINVYSDSFNPASVEIPGPAVWDGVSSSVDDRSKRMPRSSSTPSSSTNSKPCRHNTTKSKRTPKRSHNEPLRRAQQNHLS